MKIGKLLLAIVVISFTLAGCAGKSPVVTNPPTQNEVLAANYGPYPDNYEAAVKAMLKTRLVDPDSAIGLEITKPRPGWLLMQSVYSGTPANLRYGYLSTVTFNAKNRMGGYVGYDDWFALIINGKVDFLMQKRKMTPQDYQFGYK